MKGQQDIFGGEQLDSPEPRELKPRELKPEPLELFPSAAFEQQRGQTAMNTDEGDQ